MAPPPHDRPGPGRATVLPAAVAYTLVVFIVAFAVGAVRVMLVAPRIGAIAAVAFEAPIVLSVSWWSAGWSARRFRVAPDPAPRLRMGLTAFALLMVLEFAVAVLAFGEEPGPYFARLVAAPGLLGLVAQLGFAGIPWMQARRRQGAGQP